MGNFTNAFGLTVGVYGNLFNMAISASQGQNNPPLNIDVAKIKAEIDQQIQQNLEVIATDIFNGIIEKEPIDTGSLVSSITLSNFEDEIIIQIGDDTVNPKNGMTTNEYALFSEDGHMAGNSWVEGSHAVSDTLQEIDFDDRIMVNVNFG
jgi:hypothetical protein